MFLYIVLKYLGISIGGFLSLVFLGMIVLDYLRGVPV